MKKDNSRNPENFQEEESGDRKQKKPHSSAFREPNPRDEKSTTNIEEANLEQERKEAMRERD